MKIIKTILADDHRIFIEGMKAVLRKHGEVNFDIIGIAHGGNDVLPIAKREHADLIILELNLPDKDGIEIAQQLRKEKPGTRILVLTSYDEPKIVKAAFKAGVDGYILKNSDVRELFKAIQTLMLGDTFTGNGVALIQTGQHQSDHAARSYLFEDRFIRKHNLTKRELEILRLITQALSNKEIARELFISDQTVSVHRKNIMRKLGVSNTAGLIKMAYDNSLV